MALPGILRCPCPGGQDRMSEPRPPTPGESAIDVLRSLTFELDENGIPATFDPLLAEVSLNTPLLADQGFFWGNDDPGLVFTISFGGGAVPEPASLILLVSGLAVGAWARSRQGRTRRIVGARASSPGCRRRPRCDPPRTRCASRQCRRR